MLKKRFILKAGLLFALMACLVPQGVRAENFEQGAKRFIESLADEALQSLTVKDKPRDERAEKFRRLLHDYFAYRTIGAWVLGRYWRKATEAEKKEYFVLFEQLLVETYVDRFAQYPGASLQVVQTTNSGDRDVIVSTLLNRSDGQVPVKVDWRLRAREGKYKIIDLMVEGLSMGLTQRSDFASVIRQNGGTVEGLLSELRKKITKIKNQQS
ncbi:MAG: ABC transporter substrate-binding protein [Rhodospirillales bacterium]